MPDRPNILFLLTDQQRFDTIRALGNSLIRTPNLDRLVEGGTAFTNAYTPSAECVPARCTLTHGQYPAQTKCYGNGSHFPEDGRETFMQALSRSGYRTHGIGKYHFSYPDYAKTFEGHGFRTREVQEEMVSRPDLDDYLKFLHGAGFTEITDPHGIRGEMYYMPQPAMMPQKYHPTQWVGDRGETFIREAAGGDEPWYAYVSFIHPHPPFAPPSPWHKLYRDVEMPPPHLPADYEKNWVYLNRFQNRYKRYDRGFDLHRLRMIRSYYYACISFIDYQVGRILDTLDATGQADNTLILFSSDHGELLGDFGSVGKRSYHDPASRIPLVARWPGNIPNGHCCETPASLLDVTKTILESAGTSFETHTCEGENLTDLASQADRNRTLFTQLYAGHRGLYSAIDRDWKYVYSAPDERELLFNRTTDPGESTDLIGSSVESVSPRHGEGKTLKGQLLNHLAELGETDAVVDGNWKTYPKSELPGNPDAALLYQDHKWAKPLQEIGGYEA